MKITILFVAVILTWTTLYGQNAFKGKDLTVGDACPDFELSPIVNFRTEKARISDFRNKLLILDFWATWCGACYSMFPRTDSLEKEFKGAVQFLPVTYENAAKVDSFLLKYKQFRNLVIPSVTNDSLLSRYFTHTYVPHYVWIDKNGLVKAITGSEEVNSTNIQKILDEAPVVMNTKRDIVTRVDPQEPTFLVANAVQQGNRLGVQSIEPASLLFNSVLTKYIDGFYGAIFYRQNRVTCLNASLSALYRSSLGRAQPKFSPPNRTKWEVSDSSLYYLSDSALDMIPSLSDRTAFQKKHSFCYEFQVPYGISVESKFNLMIEDLNNKLGALYGIRGEIAKRVVPCFVLVRTGRGNLMPSKGGMPVSQASHFGLILKNKPLSALIDALRLPLQSKPPIEDGTNFKEHVDLDISCDLGDIQGLNNELKRYGLSFTVEPREIEMIVITDDKKEYRSAKN